MRRKNSWCLGVKNFLLISILFLSILMLSGARALETSDLETSELKISEIMYDPAFNEDYNEWLELYNSGDTAIDLSGYKLCGKELLAGYVEHGTNETKEDNGLEIHANSYAIITDGGSGTDAYSNWEIGSALALHVSAASLCGGLANTGKTIKLTDSNGAEVVSITYSSSMGASNDGNSLQLFGSDWKASLATPGAENLYVELEQENQTEQQEQPETNTTNETAEEDLEKLAAEEDESNSQETNAKQTNFTNSTKITPAKKPAQQATASSKTITDLQPVYSAKTENSLKISYFFILLISLALNTFFVVYALKKK